MSARDPWRDLLGWVHIWVLVPSESAGVLVEQKRMWMPVVVLGSYRGRSSRGKKLTKPFSFAVEYKCPLGLKRVFSSHAHRVHVAPSKDALSIREAITTTDPDGCWWVGSTGALERPVTVYERHNVGTIKVPTGWRIADHEEVVSILKKRRETPNALTPVSDLDREEHERKARAVTDRIEHARAMLAKASTRRKRAQTIEKKWARRVAALERKARHG